MPEEAKPQTPGPAQKPARPLVEALAIKEAAKKAREKYMVGLGVAVVVILLAAGVFLVGGYFATPAAPNVSKKPISVAIEARAVDVLAQELEDTPDLNASELEDLLTTV
jgi:cytoskeletal protein RodZ